MVFSRIFSIFLQNRSFRVNKNIIQIIGHFVHCEKNVLNFGKHFFHYYQNFITYLFNGKSDI